MEGEFRITTITNNQLHSDLNLEPVDDLIYRQSNRYINRLHNHTNVDAITLLDTSDDAPAPP